MFENKCSHELTQEDEIVHNQTTHCHICHEKMESKDKV